MPRNAVVAHAIGPKSYPNAWCKKNVNEVFTFCYKSFLDPACETGRYTFGWSFERIGMLFRRIVRRWMWCAASFLPAFAFAASPAADRAAQRDAFRSALAAAAKPANADSRQWATLLRESHYPLYPYVELAALRAKLSTHTSAEIEAFLKRWPDTLAASDLRKAWLRELARRGDWTSFQTFYVNGNNDLDLQCDAMQARLARSEPVKGAFASDVQALWTGERDLPDACDPVIAAARAQGALTDADVWARIERSAEAGKAGAAGAAASLLAGANAADAQRIATTLRDPATQLAQAKNWTDTPRARDAVAWGLARYARRASAAAETLWADLQPRFRWDEAQKNRVLHAIALYRATSYSPDALARLKALPDAADDDATREWHVRVALAAGDFPETLAALDRLTDVQKADARWRYLRARVLGKLDRDAEAKPILADVAREANFHGFLAADWIDQPYAICADTLAGDARTESKLTQQSDLERAFEFRELGMLHDARREWNFAMGKLDGNERRLAADYAFRKGWYDRAVFAFSADPQTQRLYEQRFPLGMIDSVRKQSRDAGIDPAWAYGILRAESAWMTDARSSANAYGLMQLLPAVAKKVAKSLHLHFGNASDLFDPEFNIRLGTHYLAQMADAYQGSPWLASAAYNAGQAPVGRWLDARAALDPDFFIETIPYKETRDYVARVLAFSVIYDWRMNGKALSLSSRMPKIGQAYKAPDANTPRKAIACPKQPVETPEPPPPEEDAATPPAAVDTDSTTPATATDPNRH